MEIYVNSRIFSDRIKHRKRKAKKWGLSTQGPQPRVQLGVGGDVGPFNNLCWDSWEGFWKMVKVWM